MAKDKKESKLKNTNNDLSSLIIKNINTELDGQKSYLIEDGSPSDVKKFISTGSTLLDYIVSNRRDGGFPVGKVSSVSGLEGTGKSLLAMQLASNAQAGGGLVVYLDTENAFNSDFANRLGLDTKNNFVYAVPDSVEEAFKIVFAVLHSLDESEKEKNPNTPPFACIIWDSVAATPTAIDIAEENTDPAATVGLKPRILSKNISTLLAYSGRKNVAMIFLNQLRTNIKAQPFQDPYIEPGGKAIPFAASIRVRLANKGKVKVGGDIVGIQCEAKCVKTRFGPPYRACEFPIYFTHGVDDAEAVIARLVEQSVIKKVSKGRNGNVFKLPGNEREFTDIELKKEFRNNPETKKQILDLLDEVMIKKMIDPNEEHIEIVAEDIAD